MTFTKREVKSEKLILRLDIELNQSTLTPEEASDAIQNAINMYNFKGFSSFIVDLLRITRSSTYELKELSLNKEKPSDSQSSS